MNEFEEPFDTVTRNLPELKPEYVRAGRVKRLGLSQFNGDMSKSSFNAATAGDVERIARKVLQIVARGYQFGETLVQHEKNFQSYNATNDHQVHKLSDLVLDNHEVMMEVQNETSRMFKRIEKTSEAIISVLRRMNGTAILVNHLREVRQTINDLAQGIFPQSTISERQLKKAISRVSRLVRKTNPDYSVVHDDPMYFNIHRSVEAQLANSSDIWITLKIPVGLNSNASKIYRIDRHPIPFSNGTNPATKIQELPDYVAIQGTEGSELKIAPMTRDQLRDCKFDDEEFSCDTLQFYDIREDSCLSAILKDNATLIYSMCEFYFYKEHLEPGFTAITKSSVMLYHVDSIKLACNGYEPYNQPGCTFCVLHVPCNCIVTYGYSSFAIGETQGCASFNPEISKYYLINIAVMMAFGTGVWDDIRASSIFDEEINLKIPKLEFF